MSKNDKLQFLYIDLRPSNTIYIPNSIISLKPITLQYKACCWAKFVGKGQETNTFGELKKPFLSFYLFHFL